jgi:hypothetical protein
MHDLSDHGIVSALFQATSAFASRIIVIPNSRCRRRVGSRCSGLPSTDVVEAISGGINRRTRVFAKVSRLLAGYHAGQDEHELESASVVFAAPTISAVVSAKPRWSYDDDAWADALGRYVQPTRGRRRSQMPNTRYQRMVRKKAMMTRRKKTSLTTNNQPAR